MRVTKRVKQRDITQKISPDQSTNIVAQLSLFWSSPGRVGLNFFKARKLRKSTMVTMTMLLSSAAYLK